MKRKIAKETSKEYIVGKGQDDFKVWTKGTDILCDYMTPKRKGCFKVSALKRDIKVTITITELVTPKVKK